MQSDPPRRIPPNGRAVKPLQQPGRKGAHGTLGFDQRTRCSCALGIRDWMNRRGVSRTEREALVPFRSAHLASPLAKGKSNRRYPIIRRFANTVYQLFHFVYRNFIGSHSFLESFSHRAAPESKRILRPANAGNGRPRRADGFGRRGRGRTHGATIAGSGDIAPRRGGLVSNRTVGREAHVRAFAPQSSFRWAKPRITVYSSTAYTKGTRSRARGGGTRRGSSPGRRSIGRDMPLGLFSMTGTIPRRFDFRGRRANRCEPPRRRGFAS